MQFALIFTAAIFGLTQAKVPAAASTDAAASATGASPASGTGLFGQASVCFPKQNNGSYDKSSPCYQALSQSIKCLAFADDGGNATAGDVPSNGIGDNLDEEQLSKRAQQIFNGTLNQECVCKPNEPGTTYFENTAGCAECLRLHGIKKEWFPAQIVSEASSSYCAMTSPTINVGSYLQQFAKTVSTPALGTSTVTDVLGSATAVSAYFTSTPVAASSSGAASSASAASAASTSASTAGMPAMTQAPWSGAALVGVLGFAVML